MWKPTNRDEMNKERKKVAEKARSLEEMMAEARDLVQEIRRDLAVLEVLEILVDMPEEIIRRDRLIMGRGHKHRMDGVDDRPTSLMEKEKRPKTSGQTGCDMPT